MTAHLCSSCREGAFVGASEGLGRVLEQVELQGISADASEEETSLFLSTKAMSSIMHHRSCASILVYSRNLGYVNMLVSTNPLAQGSVCNLDDRLDSGHDPASVPA
jgi:hypothetical protein